ncbi:pyruvate dehydrogenase complex dihydrolipoamide acetyltransferase [Fodinicurvata fenggangensis]|uniref:pyruvate dehydrogenase complex dihydrolipoamide acetyltransferase n=1 Tax=Fodinicurvata fenggangensis TaxID=1121830 RepID=UPI00047A6FA5|nr:pyruvate dehydrogenase complex dihydrolipoamide acetyltransferase [Fodinicurvata fenggangensis]
MPTNILMPALSPTMTEGTLAKWHKKEGDEVSAGDVLAEIETDKATMEVEAVDEGTLGKILVQDGTENVAVNAVIAILLDEGEDKSALEGAVQEAQQSGGQETSKSSQAEEEQQDASKSEAKGDRSEDKQAPEPASQKKAAQEKSADKGGRIFASPLARRMAEQAGLDLAQLKGSGPNGRIVKADIEKALETGAGKAKAAPSTEAASPAAPAPAAAAGPGAKEMADMLGLSYQQEPLSGMRKTIARRLTESKQTVPHFYLTIDCELDALLKVRKELNEKNEDGKISVNDFVIRAVALALQKVPAANASYDESGMLYYDQADISMAVATPAGLITPIIKNAGAKGLSSIAREAKELAQKARDNKLKPEEYQGGTFSISNLGMYGVKHFDAVINPPQGCILAIGAGEQRPVVKDGALAIATVMSCTLSVDHRAVDGAVGAEFLSAFKKLIEDPMTMLL